jgi:sugar phosphate isomerase/epimerase
MRLAFYTYSYTDRQQMPIPLCLERIAKTGYSGIDVSGTHGNSEDPNSFDVARRRLTRETAEKFRLRVEAVITHAELTSTLFDPKRKPLDLAGTVDLAADIGADVVTFHMGGTPEGISRDLVWKRTVTAIRAAADSGARRHVRLAVDGIWPTWIDDSPAALAQLFEDVDNPNFGVNFDPSYLTLMGVDVAGFAKRFAKRIVHGHFKDHQGAYPKWTHLIPGRGEMDYQRVFTDLAGAGFDGAAAAECFTSMKFAEACDSSFLALSAAAQQAKVTLGR